MATTSYGGVARHGDLADLLLDQHTQYARWSQDTLANRPAAGRSGRFFYATDTGMTYYDIGTGWVQAVSLYATVGTWTAAQTFTAQLWAALDSPSAGNLPGLRVGTRTAVSTHGTSTDVFAGSVFADNLAFGTAGGWKYLGNSNSNSAALQMYGGTLSYYTAAANSSGAGAAAATSRALQLTTAGALSIDGTSSAFIQGATTRPTNDSERLILYASSTQSQDMISVRDNAGGALFQADAYGGVKLKLGIRIPDTRSVNDAPSVYSGTTNGYRINWEFKTASVVGINDGLSNFVGLQTLSPWGDDSGGGVYQIAHAVSGMYYRYGTRSGGWQAWKPVVGMQVLGGVNVSQQNIGTGTAGAYNAYGSSFSIVAPATGKVKVTVSANSTSSAYQHLFSLSGLTGSGHGYGVAALYDSNYGTWNASGSWYVGGLTAGATYTCQPVVYSSYIASYIWNWSYTVEG